MIFSTGADGGRLLIGDENGDWLRGDIAGLICARLLGIRGFAVPVSCNTAIERCGAFTEVARTKIGSPYVIAALSELPKYPSIAGFEVNGGFLLGSDIQFNGKLLRALPTRDALLPGLILIAAASKTKLSTQVESLPVCFTASDRIQDIEAKTSKAFIARTDKDISAILNLFELGG